MSLNSAAHANRLHLMVDTYRKNYTYPAWFENNLKWAESGQITALTLQQAADKLLNDGLMKPKPSFMTFTGNEAKAIDMRIEAYHGDDISLLHGHAQSLGDAQKAAKIQRDETAATVHSLHLDQEGRITDNAEAIATHGHDYAGIDHTHGSSNGDLDWYVKLALVAAGAFLVYFIIRRKFLR